MSHQQFVGCAADSRYIDSFRPDLLGLSQQLLIPRRGNYHFRQDRLVAVDDDIYLVFLQDAKIDLAAARIRGSKKNILQLGGQHRPAPSVSKGSSACVHNNVFVILVYAHVSSVQCLDYLTVNGARCNAELVPDFLTWLWGPAGHQLFALRFAKLGQSDFPDIYCNLLDGAVVSFNT